MHHYPRNQFGIAQRVPSKKEAGRTGVKDTVARIEQSIQYMHGTVWRDEKFLKVRHKCKNQHEE